MLDLLLKNVRIADASAPVDIGLAGGRIAAIAPGLRADAPTRDMAGRFAVAGFVETHIHLDKACILDRCRLHEGTLAEAIAETAKAKAGFDEADIRSRASRVLEKAILQGTTRMRAHLEVDPVIGLKGIRAVLDLARDYAWAIDIEICVFPQEGMLSRPGVEDLMLEALDAGAAVLGGCPYTDPDPAAQIRRVFEIAADRNVDLDFHLDFDTDPDGMTVEDVCRAADRHGWGGRVAIGHVSKLSALPPDRLAATARRLREAGVAVTVLPATDLFLMGGPGDANVVRGVAPVHRLLEAGVNCSISTNNVLNPFTPFGDCSLPRMANLYANVARLGTAAGARDCLAMVTDRAARLLRHEDYGLAVGNPADIVVLDCDGPAAAVQEIAQPLAGFKRGRQTFERPAARLIRPKAEPDA